MAERKRKARVIQQPWTGVGGYYLNPAQFNYTTAQAPTDALAGGEMSTATSGAGLSSGSGAGGDGGGGGAT